eukprot:TRINITY_DN9402_c0_g1_i1.p1 TRINITY_DN9402_c0_g1~~TRINITY_DN9402_c0_g1_i1.p1  ORF type:complete len:220 (+),score=4.41 TRINITY_DN9402_c0_g1_i1:60-662(+)
MCIRDRYIAYLGGIYYHIETKKPAKIRNLSVIIRYVFTSLGTLTGLIVLISGIILLSGVSKITNIEEKSRLYFLSIFFIFLGLYLLIIGILSLFMARIYQLAMRVCDVEDGSPLTVLSAYQGQLTTQNYHFQQVQQTIPQVQTIIPQVLTTTSERETIPHQAAPIQAIPVSQVHLYSEGQPMIPGQLYYMPNGQLVYLPR